MSAQIDCKLLIPPTFFRADRDTRTFSPDPSYYSQGNQESDRAGESETGTKTRELTFPRDCARSVMF